MNADGAFVIGKTHSVCQDYVVANSSNTTPYVILSDGCSSSADTDIGARLLVKSAEALFKNWGPSDVALNTKAVCDVVALHAKAAEDALIHAANIRLAPQAVDATLLSAHISGKDLVLACSGDGALLVQNWDGDIAVYSISYPSGYPHYPTYTYQPDRLAPINPQKEIRLYAGNANQEALQLKETYQSCEPTEVLTLNSSDYQFAVLFSDGVQSFAATNGTEFSKNSRSIEFQSFARELVSFKNIRGSFVARRLNRFLKDSAQQGWYHSDDVAVGAIYLGD